MPFTILVSLLFVFVVTVGLSIASRFRTATGGLQDGRLKDCPPSPNCVCSQASRDHQRIVPFDVYGDIDEALASLRAILGTFSAATIVKDSGNYLHVEFRTTLWRFVDDLEFYADRSANQIHVRSASRVGYGDLDANRKRVEQIRRLYRQRREAPGMN